MKAKPPMTLAEMAARAARSGGRLVCPRCGCGDFRTYKTIRGHIATFRYKLCRHCGHKLMTKQEPEEAIRDVQLSEVSKIVEVDGLDGDVV